MRRPDLCGQVVPSIPAYRNFSVRKALYVFLETFPFGSGVTALQALGAGTPLLSYLHPETIFGTYFWPAVTNRENGPEGSPLPTLNSPDRHAILCARDAAEYVGLANRLISDPSWRREVGERGRAFFLDEHRKTANYAGRFFETIERIASAKLGQPQQQLPGVRAD
jgi:Glycosyl transferases group 1